MNRKCVERPIQQYPVQLVYDFPARIIYVSKLNQRKKYYIKADTASNENTDKCQGNEFMILVSKIF